MLSLACHASVAWFVLFVFASFTVDHGLFINYGSYILVKRRDAIWLAVVKNLGLTFVVTVLWVCLDTFSSVLLRHLVVGFQWATNQRRSGGEKKDLGT